MRFKPRDAAIGGGVALCYIAAAQIGFGFAVVAEQITTVWAPTGIAIATLLLCGLRFWPALWVGAFLANVGSDAPLWSAALIASGNTLEAVLAAWALRRSTGFTVTLSRVADMLRFLIVAAVLCTTVSATIGVSALCAAGVQQWARFPALWFEWWFGDLLGAIIVAPAILAAARHEWSRWEIVRAAVFATGAALVSHVVFGQLLGLRAHPIEYAIFPVAIGAAASGGLPATALVVPSASAVAIWHAARGVGPFTGQELHDSLILLQVFLGVLAVTALLLGAAISERRVSERHERDAATRLRLAQRASEESRDVLSLALRGGSMGAWSRDLVTNEVWWSRELEEIVGLEPGGFAHSEAGFFELIHPEDRLAVRQVVDEAVERRTDYAIDFRFRHARGDWRWMEGRGRAVYADDGQPRTLNGIGLDVTERKQAEMALQQAKGAAEEGQLRLAEANRELARRVREQQTLLDVLPIGIGIAGDPECREIRVNRAFARTLGLPADTNASKTAPPGQRPVNFRVLTPDGVEVPDDQLPMQIAAREGRPVNDLEFDVVHEDGRVVRLLEYAAPLMDEQGKPRGAVGAFVDLTAAHQARMTLARSEERYRRIFETAGVPLWEQDFSAIKLRLDRLRAEGVGDVHAYLQSRPKFVDQCIALIRIVDVNPATLRMFGSIDKHELTASFGRIFKRDALPAFIGALAALARGERHYEAEAAAETLDGRQLDLLVNVAFPALGEPLERVLVSLADISHQTRLYQEAADANRLKDEFLATLSHELRTPLNAVLGWAHMLREGTVQPAMRQRALESVERNARAQAQLVEDLLDVSRIMTGNLQIKSDAVDLAPVVANAVDTVRAGVTAKRLDLHVHVPIGDRIVVVGDAGRLQQVVWNLVSNAVKFTPAGGRVDIELARADSNAEIVVRDTGQGIDSSFKPHLFQRFRQMDASKTRQHGGLGLGLSIVKHLVEAHGGTVVAESAGLGKGSTFRVQLPLLAVDAPAMPAAPVPVPAASSVLASVRALVVDDDADATELTRYLLESRGAFVVTCGSAGEALRLLANDIYDILVADIGMPEQDGMALVRALRSLPPGAPNRDIRAIALTAYSAPRERDEALAAGFTAHLGKPVDPEQLIDVVSSSARVEPE
jgi:PAS domain S-box-containing protein